MSKMSNVIKVGIVQTSPVHLDLKRSLDKLISKIDESGDKGLQLLVLGETWLSGYPAWIDSCKGVALWDEPGMKKIYRRIFESGIAIPGPELTQITKRAKDYHMVICLGINEKVISGPGNGTVYNTLLIINEEGELVVHHRKLMPTFSEKLIYGIGDGKDLFGVNTIAGRVGGLICWEHWMPLARQAMHNSGELIHVALWPTAHDLHHLASRHYAFEGRCYVLAAGQLMQAREIPDEIEQPTELIENPDTFILRGGSCIFNPRGEYVTEPVYEADTTVIAEIDLDMAIEERMTLDTSGHYQRNDVFSFSVNSKRTE